MVGKKAYELLKVKVVRRSNEDVLTASVEEANDKFFIEDGTNWSGVEN